MHFWSLSNLDVWYLTQNRTMRAVSVPWINETSHRRQISEILLIHSAVPLLRRLRYSSSSRSLKTRSFFSFSFWEEMHDSLFPEGVLPRMGMCRTVLKTLTLFQTKIFYKSRYLMQWLFAVVCSLSQFVLKMNFPGQCQHSKWNIWTCAVSNFPVKTFPTKKAKSITLFQTKTAPKLSRTSAQCMMVLLSSLKSCSIQAIVCLFFAS